MGKLLSDCDPFLLVVCGFVFMSSNDDDDDDGGSGGGGGSDDDDESDSLVFSGLACIWNDAVLYRHQSIVNICRSCVLYTTIL